MAQHFYTLHIVLFCDQPLPSFPCDIDINKGLANEEAAGLNGGSSTFQRMLFSYSGHGKEIFPKFTLTLVTDIRQAFITIKHRNTYFTA